VLIAVNNIAISPYWEASFLLGQEEQDPEPESELEHPDEGFWLARNITQ
jgi:hypothetical protein